MAVASVVIPAGAESRRARSVGAHFATPIIGVLVVAILSFFAWKVLDLASTSDHARRDQIGFAAMQRQVEVQHGLEWETFADGVSPEVSAALQRSRDELATTLVALSATAAEDGPEMSNLLADVERVDAAIDRQFAAMAAGDEAAATRIDEAATDPAFAHITRDLQRLSAAEEVESRQALNGLKTGTVLGLGGAGAGIVALLCLLA